jgi:hypothetical protein
MAEDTNYQSVARKLDELDTKLNATVAANQRRVRVGFFASIVIIVILSIYLGYAYEKFGRVDPEFTGLMAQHILEDYLPEAGDKLEQQLKDSAPARIKQFEEQVRAMPDQFAQQITGETKKKIDENMPQLEEAMYKSLKTAIAQAKDEVAKSPGKTDEERFKATLQAVAAVYGTEATKAIDEFRQKYASGASDLITHLNVLAENKSLDHDQQMQRDVVQKFLILSHHYEALSGKVDLTSFDKGAPLNGAK